MLNRKRNTKQSELAQPEPKSTAGRFAYDGLERTIHEKARLSILASLAAHPDGLLFTELKTLCSLTDGNLSRQLQSLQEGELVEIWKRFFRKRPQTICRLTPHGRARFLEYISVLEKVVSDAQAQSGRSGSSVTLPRLGGFSPVV